MRLQDKAAVVTGGGAGIGRGIVLCMAREGADIAIPDIQDANAQAVVKEVLTMGRKAISMRCDVTRGAEVQATVDRIRKEMGKIDILVNNAGMASAPGMPFTNNSEEDWDRTYAVNLKSVFLMCKALAPYFIERKDGRIINIASIAGPLAALTMPPYSVAKGGVITFTRVIAKELAPHGITVNGIAPGPTITQIGGGRLRDAAARAPFERAIPLHRLATPADLHGAALFLASPASAYITGTQIVVDGGGGLGTAD